MAGSKAKKAPKVIGYVVKVGDSYLGATGSRAWMARFKLADARKAAELLRGTVHTIHREETSVGGVRVFSPCAVGPAIPTTKRTTTKRTT